MQCVLYIFKECITFISDTIFQKGIQRSLKHLFNTKADELTINRVSHISSYMPHTARAIFHLFKNPSGCGFPSGDRDRHLLHPCDNWES